MAEQTGVENPGRRAGIGETGEAIQRIVDDTLKLSFGAQLGVVRTLAVHALGDLERGQREGFLRTIMEELDRGDRGEHTYDVRPDVH